MKKAIAAVTAAVIAGATALTLALTIPVTAEAVSDPAQMTMEERLLLEIEALRLAGALEPVPAPNDPTVTTYVDPTAKNPEFEERATTEMTAGKAFDNDFERKAAQELAARNVMGH
ncbi:MAG: hypothetical protein II754_02990 [Lachnospiraceae bacterium]|nr:hypothetical protein [Lachnospiraceae bacterium]